MDEGKTPSITIEQLHAMAIVLQHGSPAAAARRLGRSKTFVLGAVNAIESRMGTRLVDRRGTRWQPTEAGQAAAGRLADLLSEFDRFTSAAGAPVPDGIGKLVVVTDLEPGLLPVGTWAGQALEAKPYLQIAVQFGQVGGDDADTDVAISDRPLRLGEWTSEVVGSVAFGLFASPRYLQANAAPGAPADLAAHALLNASANGDASTWKLFDIWDATAKPFTPTNPPLLTAGSIVDAREAARAGAGIALLPLHLAAEDVGSQRLVPVLADWRPAPIPVYCSYRSAQARNAKILTFVDTVRNGLAEFDHTRL